MSSISKTNNHRSGTPITKYIDTTGLPKGFDIADLAAMNLSPEDLLKWFKDRIREGEIPVPNANGATKLKAAPNNSRGSLINAEEKSNHSLQNKQKDKQAPTLGTKHKKTAHDLNIEELVDVKPRNIEWLWDGHIPLGKLVLLGGMPDTGKTTITHSIIATLSIGGCFPLTSQAVDPADTLILTCEDDAADTVVPRLIAAGAELARIAVIQSVIHYDDNTEEARNKPLTLAQDIHQLDEALLSRPNTKLIVFDPISAYLGAKDSHRDADVREVLGPLCDLAAKHMVTVLGITHLNKTVGADAMSRFMGSTGIIAAARAAYMTIKVDDQLMMLKAKANLAPEEESEGLKYEIRSVTIEGDIKTSRIEWTGTTNLDPTEALAAQKLSVSSPKLTAAKQFLETLLALGPKRQIEIEEDGISQGHSKATLRRAKNELGIQSHKDRFTGGWKWYTQAQWENYSEVQNRSKVESIC